MLSHGSLVSYYQLNFAMKQIHNWGLDEIDQLIPFERDIYVNLLTEHLEKQKEQQKKHS